MKIGIILSPFGSKTPTGLARFILDLTKALIKNDQENEYIIYLKEKPSVLPNFAGKNWKIEIVGFGCLWKEIGLFFAPKADIYIFNTPIIPVLFRPKKTIVLVADFAYKYFKPETFKKRLKSIILHLLAFYSLKRADKIVAISNFTKQEIIKFFNIPDSKIEVIYHGVGNICFNKPKAIDVKKPFFLFIGGTKERKNTLGVVKAFCLFKKKYGSNHKLIIVGKTGGDYFNKILTLIKKEHLEEEVIFPGFVSNQQLAYLYKKAEALVFPSLLEGLSFVVLEAMNYGLPVITSNQGALVESGGDAALLVDPKNPSEISEAMYRLISDRKLRRTLIEKGFERCKNFSWKKTAEKFSKIINSLK